MYTNIRNLWIYFQQEHTWRKTRKLILRYLRSTLLGISNFSSHPLLRFYSVLQGFVGCCRCCSVLQRAAAYCGVLEHAAACCTVLQCVAVRCSVLQYSCHHLWTCERKGYLRSKLLAVFILFRVIPITIVHLCGYEFKYSHIISIYIYIYICIHIYIYIYK